MKIVHASTTELSEDPDRRAGGRAAYVENSAAVAAFEGIPFIDLSAGMWAKILAGTPASTFMTDNVHPRDAGHQLYFEAIRDALDKSTPLAVQPSITGGRLIDQSNLQSARLAAASQASGCHAANSSLACTNSALTCDRGDSISYRFSGTTVGMIRAMCSPEGGCNARSTEAIR